MSSLPHNTLSALGDPSLALLDDISTAQLDTDLGTVAKNASGVEIDPKTGKPKLLGLGKKKTDPLAAESSGPETPSHPQAVSAGLPQTPVASTSSLGGRPADLKSHMQPIPVSPRSPYHSMSLAASPGLIRSHSPRLHSPADSEIFERNVQEPVAIAGMTSDGPAHIPAHVITEDFIPPALEASAQAITSEELNPDEVEIVTSAAHQTAAASVLESSTFNAEGSQLHSPTGRTDRFDDAESTTLPHSGILPQLSGDIDDGASNYGQLDPTDVRRLSFISFADIVQSEQQNFATESISQVNLHEPSFPTLHDSSASPLRSPLSTNSPRGVTTPPLPSVNVALTSASSPGEQSSVRSSNLGSPPSVHGELTIETMRQAVRKTASGDLSGVRSTGMSPI